MRIVVTECDHDSFDVEFAVARANGAELVIAQSRNRDEVVANATARAAVVITGDVHEVTTADPRWVEVKVVAS